MATEVEVYSDDPETTPATGSDHVYAMIEALQLFRTYVSKALVDGIDYGVIPGTQKPTLLQPGAQKICFYYRVYPDQEVTATEMGNGHVEYVTRVRLKSQSSGRELGQGMGSCSTMESRYRYRNADRVCPACGKPTIIKGKEEYGGGYICFMKKGGCGAKFGDHDQAIVGQAIGKIENPDIADVRNTVLKISFKRALVNSAMCLGCASELFTQDLEDFSKPPGRDPEPEPPRPQQPQSQPQRSDRSRTQPPVTRQPAPSAPRPARSQPAPEPRPAEPPSESFDQMLVRVGVWPVTIEGLIWKLAERAVNRGLLTEAALNRDADGVPSVDECWKALREIWPKRWKGITATAGLIAEEIKADPMQHPKTKEREAGED
jgi:hypothetical protein